MSWALCFTFFCLLLHTTCLFPLLITCAKRSLQTAKISKEISISWMNRIQVKYLVRDLSFLMIISFCFNTSGHPSLDFQCSQHTSVKFQHCVPHICGQKLWCWTSDSAVHTWGPFIHTYRKAEVLRPHTHCTGYNVSSHPHTKRLKNRDLHCDAILCKCDARSPVDVTESSDVV